MSLLTISACIIAYLLGSVSTAIITCKAMGLPDPRTEGSKNPGGTNVLRIGGKKAALITVVGDVLKGVIPVLVFKYGTSIGISGLGWVSLAAVVGHMYPLYYRFEGGKGVATLVGVTMALYWPLALAMVGVWVGMAVIFRYSSLASLTAVTASPAVACGFGLPIVLPWCVLAMLIIWKHRSNIQRLMAGKESKIGQKSKKPSH